MSANNEHPNVHYMFNKVVKYVSKNEANRYNIVYPSIMVNSLLLENPVFNESKGKYKITMKRLEPFPMGKTMNINISSGAFKMLSNQLNRLHNANLTHSNLKAAESRLKKPGGKIDVFAPLKRQLLVEYNDTGKKISKIYLTNFNIRKTLDTINNEKDYVSKFRLFYNKANNYNTIQHTTSNNNGYTSPNEASSSRRRLF